MQLSSNVRQHRRVEYAPQHEVRRKRREQNRGNSAQPQEVAGAAAERSSAAVSCQSQPVGTAPPSGHQNQRRSAPAQVHQKLAPAPLQHSTARSGGALPVWNKRDQARWCLPFLGSTSKGHGFTPRSPLWHSWQRSCSLSCIGSTSHRRKCCLTPRSTADLPRQAALGGPQVLSTLSAARPALPAVSVGVSSNVRQHTQRMPSQRVAIEQDWQ